MQTRNLPSWFPLGILAAAIVLLFYRLFLGETFFWGLPSLQFHPWRWLAFEQLSDSHIPFWNPYNGGGAPLLANYQSAILYPPNWLYLFIPSPRTMSIIALLHVFWAGIGMWHLTGKLELNTLGRGISVLCFALGSYTLGRLGSFPTSNTTSWIPWLFWACLRVMEHQRLQDMGILGLITGVQLLAGHAQTSWYAFVALGLFAWWYVLWPLRPSGRRVQIEALTRSIVGLLLGAGIASWQLAITAEFLQQSHRAGGVDFATLTNLSYAPLRILTMIMPHLFGTPADGSYLTPGKGVYFEDAAYIGFLPLVSAIFAMIGWIKWRKFLPHHTAFRSVPFWTFLSLSGLVLALGRFTPLYRFLYDYIPTFDNFREPVRWLIWPAFGLSIMAGIGVHNWNRSQLTLFWTRLAAAGGGSVALVALASTVLLDIDSDVLSVLAKALMALGCWIIGTAILTLTQPTRSLNNKATRWQVAVLIFVAADLSWAVIGLNPTITDDFYDRDFSISEPQGRLYWFEDYHEEVKFEEYFDLSDYRRATDRWTQIRTSLLPNLNILDRIEVFNNFDPLQPAVHTQYIELIEATANQSTNLLRAASVGEVYGAIQPTGWQQEQPYVSKAPETPPTAWMVSEVIWVENEDTAIEYMLDPNWDPEQTAILIADDTLPPTSMNTTFSTPPEVEIVSEQPNKQQYEVISEEGGYLVVANTWYPGWKVSVDGERVPLYQANLAFRGVYIPPGGADVTFSYTPRRTGISLTLSIVSLFLTVALIAWGAFQENR